MHPEVVTNPTKQQIADAHRGLRDYNAVRIQ